MSFNRKVKYIAIGRYNRSFETDNKWYSGILFKSVRVFAKIKKGNNDANKVTSTSGITESYCMPCM